MYTLKNIMEMLNIPERTIRRHIKLGLLKGDKVGGTWRFSEHDIHQYFSRDMTRKTQRHNHINEVMDYLNGISKEGEELMIIKQIKKLSLKQKLSLSAYISDFKNPFYFNLEEKGDQDVVTFKGSEEQNQKLLAFLKAL